MSARVLPFSLKSARPRREIPLTRRHPKDLSSMTTPAQTNLSGSSGKPPDGGGFEASGLSPEEAERLAAEFKPSWELDEPVALANGNGGHAELQARHSGDARTVAPHTPPQRVETH